MGEADDDARRARALELRVLGWTNLEIKRSLGVGSDRLGRWLRDAPPPPPRPHPRSKESFREKAVELRRLGFTYREIAEILPVATSTLSNWLAEVPLVEEHRVRVEEKRLERRSDRASSIRAGRIRRTEVLKDEAAGTIETLTHRDLFLLGVVAYRCEGTKEKDWGRAAQVTFVNSDPALIRLFIRWTAVIGVPPGDLVYRVAIHATADVEAAERYWREVAGGEPSQWRRTTLKRHRTATIRHNTGNGYFGCLAVTIRRSAALNRRIDGWFAGVVSRIEDLGIHAVGS